MSFEAAGAALAASAQWAWNTSVSGALAVAVVFVVQTTLRNVLPPAGRLALWWLVVAHLILPVLPNSPFSVFNWIGAAGSREDPAPDLMLLQTPAPARVEAAADVIELLPLVHTGGYERNAGLRLAQYVWGLGVVLFLGVVLIQHRRMAVWARAQPPLATEAIERLLAECAGQLNLRRSIVVISTTTLSTPAVFGVFRPRVLMPKDLLETLTEDELRLIFLHELTHIKRLHVLQNWLMLVVQSLHWFNPAVWFAFRQLRYEREVVCDRAVVKHLQPGHRDVYGATLIKLAQHGSALRPAATLVPILSRKQHIHRRIRMISNYKTISRAAAALSALLVAALGCFLLTAAEKRAPEAKPEPPKEAKPEPGVRPSVQADHQEGIEALKNELERLDDLTRKKEREVDLLKERLGISEIEESAHGKPDPDMLRRMEALHIDAMAQYQQISTLYSTLTNLSRSQLLSAVATASPDAQLAELQSRFALAEQNYAEGFEKYGADHPDSKKTRRAMEQIQQQINTRLEGVMQGLKVRTEAQKSSTERLQHELAKAKEYNIDRTIQQRPYFVAKRELENLHQVRDEIWKRLIMEQIDAKLPPGLRRESGRSL